ncbi:MAG: Epoxyqueuosine reductase [Gammaproteobacteria bacterium]|nr:Epoxyqueuosine reductase [Gammaproteobacteria bacterium]
MSSTPERAESRQPLDYVALARRIGHWARQLGFDRTGIADTDLQDAESHLMNWLDEGRHGGMEYMAAHGRKRSRPELLVPGTIRVICVCMSYWPDDPALPPEKVLGTSDIGYVARYALGRDYHKILRRRLQRLADRIEDETGLFGYRAFTDSAPVLEKPLAEKAGLGWIGKHTNVIDKTAGSWFFLGELYTDLPLPVDDPAENHCGTCRACIDACPTGAIVAPYQLDARRCISYLTIEFQGSIPESLRPSMGNRIFGCDDCQAICPWNRFAQFTDQGDFSPRAVVTDRKLAWFASWSEDDFNRHTIGSAIRRTGYEGLLRNVAVALGNAVTSMSVRRSIGGLVHHPSALVREHAKWAKSRHPRA